MKKSLIALALLSTPALAQQAPTQQMPDLNKMFFEQFDTDKDGLVSKAEFLKPTVAQFDHMDRNKDGMLDEAEVKAFNAEMNQRMEEMQRRMMQQQGAPRR
jgi:Ca2+-binding EF-hand superfamily protein